MSEILILPEFLINKIAAGEVVERPFSVVKELVENAIDAKADHISVTVKNGGKNFISVVDNGVGMDEKNASLAIERHATSKLKENDNLDQITTMGFRGEALAAISSVSKFELTTCYDEKKGGFVVRMSGNKIIYSGKTAFPQGTKIVVEDLFFNTPARKKFMKAEKTEFSHIHDFILRTALSHPKIHFKLVHNKHLALNLPKTDLWNKRVAQCFGNTIIQDLIELKHEEAYLSFEGLLSSPEKSRPSKRWQHIYVNGRNINSSFISRAIYEGYRTLLMKQQHPIFILKLNLLPQEIDVNVHPAKTEVRFRNQNLVYTIISSKIHAFLKQERRQIFFGASDEQRIEYLNGDLKQNKPLSSPQESESDAENPQNVSNPFRKLTNNNFANSSQLSLDLGAAKSKKTVLKPEESQKKDEILMLNAKEKAAVVEVSSSEKQHDWNVIGQYRKYILSEYQGALVYVDIHAAHERIRFEEIRTNFYSNVCPSMSLTTPILLTLHPGDGLILEQYESFWKNLGFVVDHLGKNDYAIKEVPTVFKDIDVKPMIQEILEEMSLFGKASRLETYYNQVFETMACHSSVRGESSLSFPEMNELINQLSQLDIHLFCPHGRPVMIETSMEELDKRFKRS